MFSILILSYMIFGTTAYGTILIGRHQAAGAVAAAAQACAWANTPDDACAATQTANLLPQFCGAPTVAVAQSAFTNDANILQVSVTCNYPTGILPAALFGNEADDIGNTMTINEVASIAFPAP